MDTSLNLLPPLGEVINRTGDRVRGSGWYGYSTGLHTVAINVSNFQGRIRIQASIATDPSDGDWYTVLPDGVDYIQYPRPGTVLMPPQFGETSTFGFNFSTNAVWVRAIVERDYLIPNTATPEQIAGFGTVNYILLNY